MNSKQRFLNALERKLTDRLPVTTHHLMPSFLKNYMNGISDQEFFDHFGLDPVKWIIAHTFDGSKGEYFDPDQPAIGFLEAKRICTNNWRFTSEEIKASPILPIVSVLSPLIKLFQWFFRLMCIQHG